MLGSVFFSACSTFEDVKYGEKVKQQLDHFASDNDTLAQRSDVIALSKLVSVEDIDTLITDALGNNPSLQQTLLTLKTTEQQLNVTGASQWPSVSVGLNSNKSEASSVVHTASADIAWTLDIWQQLANASDAQQATVAASAYAYQAAKDLLVANVIKAYLALIQINQLVEIESERVDAYQTNERVIIDRYRKGLIKLNELDTATSSRQSSQAALVDYRAQYQQALRNLSLLTGIQKNTIVKNIEFPQVLMPLSQLEQQNLAWRPDLQQAYQNIIARQYQHKVAYKSLLPSLSITASLTDSNSNLHDALFGSNAWQLLGQLTAPIFNAGKLTSEVEIAKLAAEQSYWAFQEKLLAAVNEVDNAIAQEQAVLTRLQYTKKALTSAKRSEATYTERYRQGTVSLLELLQVQQQTFSLRTQVTQLNYELLNNRISLGLALGLGA